MKINSNLGMRERSKVMLTGFKGLDTLSASVNVNAIHATEMQNLISRDGVNHKRFGWKTRFRIRDGNGEFLKIQGIFDFYIYSTSFLIVYAGKKFWLINKDKGDYIDVTTKSFSINKNNDSIEDVLPVNAENAVNSSMLNDVECKSFTNGNKVYFIGCGDYLVFSKWSNDKFEIRRVADNEDVYIPTTTENIGSEEYGKHITRITAEERNLLSSTYYNTLFGVNELNYQEDKPSYLTYYLDNTGFDDLEVIIKSEQTTEDVVLRRTTEKGYYTKGDSVTKIITESTEITKNLSSENNVRRNWHENGILKPSCFLAFRNDLFFDLIKMENGDSIALKIRVVSDTRVLYYTIEGISVSVRYPNQCEASVYYRKKDGTDIYIDHCSNFSFDYSVNKPIFNKNTDTISVDSDFKCSFSIRYEGSKDRLFQINSIISEVCYGSYLNEDSVVIKSGDYEGSYVSSTGKLSLKAVKGKAGAYKPIVPDVPNITVKFYRKIDSSIFCNKTSCLFGLQGKADRLFIVDKTGNTIRWSKDVDFTYFGEKSWCVCGTTDKRITGMDKLNDSTLLIVKEYSPKEPSVYVVVGKFLSKETEAETIDYVALFSPHGYQVGMGAVGEVINFNGDCIMTCKDGLYAVSLGENMTVDSRYLLHRSRQISNSLEKFDLSKAKCVSFNGKFYIYVGGKEQECYVADNKYTASFDGDIQNAVNYEWWRWTNIPVNVWGFVENELWFGTEDGQLCSFTENFYDESLTIFPSGKGLLYYDCEDIEDSCDCGKIIGFGFVNDIKYRKGDIFTPTCDFYGGITTDKLECVNGETRFYLPLNDYLDGENIYIDNKEYAISKNELYFSIQYDTKLSEITFYRNYKNKPLILTEESVSLLQDSAGNYPIWSKVVSSGGLNPNQNDFSASLSHKEPVVSKWVSGAMDLGSRAYSKTLTHLVLTGEKDLANHLKYGLKTRFTTRYYSLLRANNDLDYTDLDMQSISLDSEFASSYTKKLNLRNVNFVMFYFLSDTPEDIALNSIEIEFKLYKRNIGVN